MSTWGAALIGAGLAYLLLALTGCGSSANKVTDSSQIRCRDVINNGTGQVQTICTPDD